MDGSKHLVNLILIRHREADRCINGNKTRITERRFLLGCQKGDGIVGGKGASVH